MNQENVWLTPQHAGYYRGGAPAVEWYNNWVLGRREKYPDWESRITTEISTIADEISDKGYYKIENFWDTTLLDELRDKTYEKMKSADPEIVKYPQKGQHTQIQYPLLNMPLCNTLATNDTILGIASAFLGCLPSLGTTNLRLSTSELSKEAGTCMFHRDFNSPVKLIKFFTYFNDVTMENGPFTYVESSNRQMPSSPHWSTQHRWPNEPIEELYGKERIINLTANYGDLLIATTNGWHKGLPLQQGQRLMLTLNYIVHPELGGSGIHGPPQPSHRVSRELFDTIPEAKRGVYDYVEKV